MISVWTGAKHGSKKPKNRASGYQTKNIRANRCKARILIWKPIPLWCVHLIIVQSSILTREFGPVSEHLTDDLRCEHIMDVGMYKDARQLCFKQQLALVTLQQSNSHCPYAMNATLQYILQMQLIMKLPRMQRGGRSQGSHGHMYLVSGQQRYKTIPDFV